MPDVLKSIFYNMNGVSEYAIVLRSFIPRKYKWVMLGALHGKIEVISTDPTIERIGVGMLVLYCADRGSGGLYRINQIDVISWPPPLESGGGIIMMQLLNVAYYFLMLDQPAPDMFKLLALLGRMFESWESIPEKRWIMGAVWQAVLYVLVGFSPPKKIAQALYDLQATIWTSLDRGMAATIQLTHDILHTLDNEARTVLKLWIDECLNTHPMKRASNRGEIEWCSIPD